MAERKYHFMPWGTEITYCGLPLFVRDIRTSTRIGRVKPQCKTCVRLAKKEQTRKDPPR